MNSDLTIRETKLVDGILSGKSIVQAALSAGYSESYAHNLRLKDRKRVRSAMIEALEDRGLDAGRFAKVLDEGLTATKAILEDGRLVEMPDHGTRHRFLETGLKVSGYLKEPGVGLELGIISIPATMTLEEWDREKNSDEDGK